VPTIAIHAHAFFARDSFTMTKNLHVLFITTSIALQGYWSAQVVRAQDFPLPASVIANVQPELQAAARAEAQRYANPLYQRLLLKLDEIQRVCEPSAAQMSKLNVAVKGAVDHALDRWLASNADRLRAGVSDVVIVQANPVPAVRNAAQVQKAELEALQRQLQLAKRALERKAAAGEGKGATPAEERVRQAGREALAQQQKALLARQQELEQQVAQMEQNAADVQVRQQLGMAGGVVFAEAVQRNAPVNSAPATSANDPSLAAENEKTWTTALQFTLTDEQKGRLTAAASERSSFQPSTAAERVLKEIDQRLLLDRVQRDKLSPFVKKAVDQQSVEGIVNRNPNLVASVAINVLRALPEDQLRSVLSERQRTQRLRLLEPQAAVPTNVNRVLLDGFAPVPVAIPAPR
jgi:hypothetical protein